MIIKYDELMNKLIMELVDNPLKAMKHQNMRMKLLEWELYEFQQNTNEGLNRLLEQINNMEVDDNE